MSATPTLHTDNVYRAIDDRQQQELRFRSAVITSTAMHTGLTLAVLLGPLFAPKPVLFDFTPVNLVQLQPTPLQPEPAPAPVEERDEAVAPEPEEIKPPPPEDVPEDLEAQRIKEEEAAAKKREEDRKRREEEEARRKAAEEARRRREEEERRRKEEEEEEARRAPQQATRNDAAAQQPQQITQQAERGQVGMTFGDTVSAQDMTYLDYWINRVLTNISINWDQPARPQGSREIVAVVNFRVGRNGQFIIDPDIRSTSGDRRYDAAAVRAVRAGQPFPPLPQAYRGNTLTINLAFRQ